MKFLTRIVAILCFALPFTLSAQNSIVGKWKLTVPTEDGGTMDIQVSMNADNTYNVDFGIDGTAEVNGEYKLNGDKITIKDVSGPQACPQEALYSIEVSATNLTMTRISDPCEGRGGPEGVMTFTRN
jgi:hypothetical protein